MYLNMCYQLLPLPHQNKEETQKRDLVSLTTYRVPALLK